MVSAYNSTSVAEMITAFPVQNITPIAGRPTLLELLRVLKLLCRCSCSVKSYLSQLGYLFVALDPTSYRQYSATPVILPGPTPDIPTFNDAMTPGDREVARLSWQAHKMETTTYGI